MFPTRSKTILNSILKCDNATVAFWFGLEMVAVLGTIVVGIKIQPFYRFERLSDLQPSKRPAGCVSNRRRRVPRVDTSCRGAVTQCRCAAARLENRIDIYRHDLNIKDEMVPGSQWSTPAEQRGRKQTKTLMNWIAHHQI